MILALQAREVAANLITMNRSPSRLRQRPKPLPDGHFPVNARLKSSFIDSPFALLHIRARTRFFWRRCLAGCLAGISPGVRRRFREEIHESSLVFPAIGEFVSMHTLPGTAMSCCRTASVQTLFRACRPRWCRSTWFPTIQGFGCSTATSTTTWRPECRRCTRSSRDPKEGRGFDEDAFIKSIRDGRSRGHGRLRI